MHLVLQISFRRFPHNHLQELKHLIIVSMWYESLIEFIPFSKSSYNSWGVGCIFIWNVLLLYYYTLSMTLPFLHLKEVVFIMSKKFKKDTSASWVDPAFSSTISIFVRESGVNEAFLNVVHFCTRAPWLLMKIREFVSSMENVSPLSMNVPFRSLVFGFLSTTSK